MTLGQPMTGEDQPLRRKRLVLRGQWVGRNRARRRWQILPRYGTGPDDRWTLIATPVPGASNPAASIEDGQYATLAEAYAALADAMRTDDGTHDPLT